MKDNIYKKIHYNIQPFQFNKKVVNVFDDMLNRSIPSYKKILEYSAGLSHCFFQKKKTSILDIGCSIGNVLPYLIKKFSKKKFCYVGLDYSQEMIDFCQKRFFKEMQNLKIYFVCESALNFTYPKSNIILAHFVLQFIGQKDRLLVLKKIYNSLEKKGIFFFQKKFMKNQQ